MHLSTPTITWTDKVNVESWQLVTAILDEGDGLILCEWHNSHLESEIVEFSL